MRISDWSSDVCSSDLEPRLSDREGHLVEQLRAGHQRYHRPRARAAASLARPRRPQAGGCRDRYARLWRQCDRGLYAPSGDGGRGDVGPVAVAVPRAARDARRSGRVAHPRPPLYAVDLGRDGVAAPQGLDHQNLIRPNIPLDETYITYIIPINRMRDASGRRPTNDAERRSRRKIGRAHV